MERTRARTGGRWLRALAVVLIGLAVIAPGLSGRAAADEGHAEQPLDLAAMTLRPEDLATAGLDGYGADLGELTTAEQQVAEFIEVMGGNPDEVREALIDEAGLQGGYWMRIGLPLDPGNINSVATRAVLVTLNAFADEEGAEQGYRYMTEMPVAEDGEPGPEMTSVDADISVGDAFDLAEFETEAVENGDPIQGLSLFFRNDRIIADVTLIDVLREGEPADDPRVEEIATLGELLVERIDAGLDGEAPGLSGEIVRLADAEGEVETKLDIYTTVGSVAIHRFAEAPDVTADRTERYAAAGIVDVYAVEQSAVLGGQASFADPYYSARIFQFEDEDAAAAWLEGEALSGIENATDITAFDRIERIDPLGDGVVAATYSAALDGTAFHGRIVAVRIGDVVALMRMESGGGINLDTLLEVVQIQLDCLTAGACAGPVAPPAGFIPA